MIIIALLLLVGMVGAWLIANPHVAFTLCVLFGLAEVGMWIETKWDDATTNPQDRMVSVVEAHVGHYYVPSATLTLSSTIKHDYEANAAICSIRGPIYYKRNMHGGIDYYPLDGQPATYVGERRLLLAYYPSYYSKDLQGSRDEPVVRYNRKTQVEYYGTTATDVVTNRDTVEWCQVGENLSDLAKSLGITVNSAGVIENRFQWLDGGANPIPVDQTITAVHAARSFAGYQASLRGVDAD